ncbi:MAG: hypothetical protein N3A53_01915 [Verrucomicrobiae bacterium]|nr:hypothetical protein [Verrucomicrobiae bacterium]
MSAFFVDGDFSVAAPNGGPVFSNPFPEITGVYVLRQQYIQKLSDFSPLPLSTPHPDYPDFVLTGEDGFQNVGAGIITWTRTYAKLPPPFNQYTTMNYNFIGFFGTFGINNTAVSGRERFTATVPVRIQNDFYLISENPEEEIPFERRQIYCIGDITQATDYLGDDDILDIPSTPLRSTYETWVNDGVEIVAEDSTFKQWLGKYYIRQTKYIKAQ